jgi:hypothetical protein
MTWILYFQSIINRSTKNHFPRILLTLNYVTTRVIYDFTDSTLVNINRLRCIY